MIESFEEITEISFGAMDFLNLHTNTSLLSREGRWGAAAEMGGSVTVLLINVVSGRLPEDPMVTLPPLGFLFWGKCKGDVVRCDSRDFSKSSLSASPQPEMAGVRFDATTATMIWNTPPRVADDPRGRERELVAQALYCQPGT
jgi:hypothetical protein